MSVFSPNSENLIYDIYSVVSSGINKIFLILILITT